MKPLFSILASFGLIFQVNSINQDFYSLNENDEIQIIENNFFNEEELLSSEDSDINKYDSNVLPPDIYFPDYEEFVENLDEDNIDSPELNENILPLSDLVESNDTTISSSRDSVSLKQSNKFSRLDGKDRYETSAKTALTICSKGCDNVFIASGNVYSDGIAISPLAISKKGVILLVKKNEIPESIISALKIINPKNIYVAGGLSTISDKVFSEIKAITNTEVFRINGVNRYETAKLISKEYLEKNSTVFLTTGRNWPDALSIAPIAGINKSPIILTEGGDLGNQALEILKDFKPTKVVLVGGKYSSNTLNNIKNISNPTIVTLTGTTRFETAIAVSKYGYPNPSMFVYVTSNNFSDSLGASTIAAAVKSPIMLLDKECTKPTIMKYTNKKPGILIGGLNSTTSTAATTQCVPPPKPPNYSKLPVGSPAWLVEIRNILNSVGGSNYKLEEFNGICGGVNAIACSYSTGEIKVHYSINNYSNSYKKTVMAHELAHQYQFKVWNTLMQSQTYKTLYRSNIEHLANCMASAKGYYEHGQVCNSSMINYAKNIWNGKVIN